MGAVDWEASDERAMVIVLKFRRAWVDESLQMLYKS